MAGMTDSKFIIYINIWLQIQFETSCKLPSDYKKQQATASFQECTYLISQVFEKRVMDDSICLVGFYHVLALLYEIIKQHIQHPLLHGPN